MPMKSQAQWRAMAAKMQEGSITKAMFEEMCAKTKGGYRRLPEKVKKK